MNTGKELFKRVYDQPITILREELTKSQVDICIILFDHTFHDITASGLLEFKELRYKSNTLANFSFILDSYYIASELLTHICDNFDEDKMEERLSDKCNNLTNEILYLNFKIGKLKQLIIEYNKILDDTLNENIKRIIYLICVTIKEITYLAG